MENMNDKARRMYISSEIRFYGIKELAEELKWSEARVQKLFNDPRFPSCDFGKRKVVEAHAVIDYFFNRRERDKDRYWR